MSTNLISVSSPRDLLQIVKRHSREIGALCLLCLIVAVGVIAFYPKSYVSTAKLYVRVGREIATLDPTATTGETVAVRVDQVREINSLLDILRSRAVAERVVDAVGVDRILGKQGDPDASPAAASSSASKVLCSIGATMDRLKAFASEPVDDRELAVLKVQNMTEVRAPRESKVLEIVCTAGSPELARDVAAATTDIFLKEHLRLSRTKGTHQFFDEQSELLRERLDEASRELAARKSDFQLMSVESKRKIVAEELKTVRLELLAAERSLTASRAKVHNLQAEVTSVPAQIDETVTGFSRDAWNTMRDKLYGVEIVASELRSKYTDDHPAVAAVMDQQRRLSEILEDQPQDRTQVTSVKNPTRQAIEAELLGEKAKVATLEATRDMLASQHAKAIEELELLNDQEYQIATLQRRVELLDANYRTHAVKMEEARIYDALEDRNISSFNIVQEATLMSKPVSPNKRAVLLSAIAISMFGGFGLALFSESRGQTIRWTSEAEPVPSESGTRSIDDNGETAHGKHCTAEKATQCGHCTCGANIQGDGSGDGHDRATHDARRMRGDFR